MANWDRKFSNGSYYNNWNGRLVYNLNWQDGATNRSNISLTLQTFSDSGSYTQNGSWDGRLYVNGGQVARNTPTANVGPGAYTITSWSGDVYHDANGYLSINIGDYINAPVNEMTFAEIGWGLPRIGYPPSISDTTADTIKPLSARLGAELSSVGRGTSATWTMYYRLQGAGSWTSAGSQGDVGGYNYWNISGLKPGKVYEYYAYLQNNNGDNTSSSVKTFKTKAVSGMTPILMGLLR